MEGKKTVEMGHFNEQWLDNRIQNEIILDDELKTVLSFGNDCNNFLCTRHNFKFHHFKNIKMNLYDNLDTIKVLNSEKEADIMDIITFILIEMKKKAIDTNQINFS